MFVDINNFKLKCCPHCFGSGRLKAMQSAIASNSKSVRSVDTTVECHHCKGTGLK